MLKYMYNYPLFISNSFCVNKHYDDTFLHSISVEICIATYFALQFTAYNLIKLMFVTLISYVDILLISHSDLHTIHLPTKNGGNMIVLASASPRRQTLLKEICSSFSVEPADIDETVDSDIALDKIPEELAYKKAMHIFGTKHSKDIVIGCDTGVFIDNLMLGKPKNEAEAVKMLSMLSGRQHRVITGCAIISNKKTVRFSQITKVEFYKLSQNEIEDYVKSGEPMDKAGAYGIQGKGMTLVKGINGDYFSVVGLPVARLGRELKSFIK